MSRTPRPRGTRSYSKPPLSIDDLTRRLADRGLEIPDRSAARRHLQYIGYYRLSPYTIPFQRPGQDHAFRDGVSVDDVLDLYNFDRALRLLVMDALERVEVAIRAALTDHMATTYDDPHWYVKPAHFRDHGRHRGLVGIIRGMCEERLRGTPDAGDDALVHRSALEHYVTTYRSPELPPSWVAVEMLTIGQLAATYRNLGRRSDRTSVARSVGLTAPVLESWMLSYVRVRNICAHHGRLWNVGLGVYPAIPTSAGISWLVGGLPERSSRRLYPVLVSLQTVLDSVSPDSSWPRRLHALLRDRPRMNLIGMGVPDGWAEDGFWRRHLTD